MVFSSIPFVFFFLPACLLLYFLLPWKLVKNLVLLVFSLIFYAWGEPIYVILMVLNILFNFGLGLFMDKIPEWKRFLLILGLLVNIALLGFFKYAGFFIDSVNSLCGTALQVPQIALPIGISFYTCQTLSYVIDLYRGNIKVQKNPILFGVYITMFPQLIAGPIVRYTDIEADLNDRKISLPDLGEGFLLFLLGLAKKVILANNIGKLYEATGFQYGEVPVLTAWLGLIAFGLQLYFDFSGYSDMAIGLGRMLGFHFPDNFNSPYAAKSITDFWRRWHMTLGTWFREYVYIPLGGNRVKPLRHILNIMIVWGLTGLWHGASLNFLLWGFYYGVLLIFEKYVLSRWKKKPKGLMETWTLVLVFLGWGLFVSTNSSELWWTFSNLFDTAGQYLLDGNSCYLFVQNILLLIAAICCATPMAKQVKNRLVTEHSLISTVVALFLFIICIAFMVSDTYNPFLYFRF